MSLPEIVSREEWLTARTALLEREKAHTRARDALNADRRRLPMVKVTKDYQFDGPEGAVTLGEMFSGRRQLLVQHVMFGPDWEDPCPSCSSSLSLLNPALLGHLHQRGSSFVLVSRAPYARISQVQQERGYPVQWYSSYGSDFNFDLGVSFGKDEPAPHYNYRDEPQLHGADEMPGFSCFLRDGDDVFHTYSTYARGTDYLVAAYPLLDLTALGRQEDWEEPKGRVEKPHPADPSFTS